MKRVFRMRGCPVGSRGATLYRTPEKVHTCVSFAAPTLCGGLAKGVCHVVA